MTEKSVKIFLAVFAAAAAFCLAGAEDLPVFGKIRIKVSLQEPPRVKMNSSSSGSGKLVQTNRNWGVIRVDFCPGLGKDENHAKKAAGAWLDDVTMALQVILLDSGVKKSGGYALFDGRCDFWTIALDNRIHSAYMFIAPQLLERYLPSKRNSGTVRAAQAGDFKVRAIFFHKKYGVIGEGYAGFSGFSTAKLRREFNSLKESVSSRNILNGALLTRMRTPWGLADMGHFDLIKPETILPALNEEALEKAAQEAEAKERQDAAKQTSEAAAPASSSTKTKKKKR